MAVINAKTSRLCAFCKNWYDPTNQYIKPRYPASGIFEYDPKAKCKCMVKNIDKPSVHTCSNFANKLY